ncbi:hypothetical protein GL296_12655 [Turicibacter sanguinis]|nr:hypothetical protein [Turicibacter sanguinis]MTK90186.1 hypothetical protein [Turicibacter sanguinis]MTL27467.1 hypothetical protein [Turicibacter sanguinis]
MKLTEQIEINKDVIDYINSLTKTGKSLANIIKSEKGDIDKNSLEKLRKNYSRKISKAGYRYNSDLAMYQPKDSSANTNTPNKVDGSKDSSANTNTPNKVDGSKDSSANTNTPNKVDGSKDSSANTNTPNKVDGSKEKQDRPRKRVTKKEKELEKTLKENPLYFETQTYKILENIDQIYNDLENGSVQLSVLTYPSLLKEFKKLEKRFGYIGGHYTQSCAILSCYNRINQLKGSTLLHEYLNLISTDLKYEKKKQITIRTSKMMDTTKKLLEYEFPFLSKGDVIGFCFFAFLKCYEKTWE